MSDSGVPKMPSHENTVLLGDCRVMLAEVDDGSVDSCVTSPPYWGDRDYGVENQLGIEPSPFDYVDELFKVFSTVQKKLVKTGNLFVVIDDVWASNWSKCREHTWISSKSNDEGVSSEKIRDKCKIDRNWPAKLGINWLKAKQELMLPERLSIRMQETGGWFVREKIVWFKENCGNYTNVRDRFAHSYEHVLHFTKSQAYYADMDAITVNGKLTRDVISIPIERNSTEHSASFPMALAGLLVNFSCPEGGTVLDPFSGIGTTLIAAKRSKRNYIGIEISKKYRDISISTLAATIPAKTRSLDSFIRP